MFWQVDYSRRRGSFDDDIFKSTIMILNYNKGYIIALLLLIFTIKLNAQRYSELDIDSLQTKEIKRLMENGDYNGVIVLEKKLLKRSQELHYTKGEIRGYINLANYLCGLNRNKESFYFLSVSEKMLKEFNDPILITRLNIIYGKNYHGLGLYKESLLSFNKAIRLAYRISDKEERNRRLNYIYNQKMIAFTEKGIMDSVYAMERKLPVNSALYVSLAERNLKGKKLDSAEYYLSLADSFFNKVPAESKSRILLSYGELYFEKKEYEEALKYYFQSLELVRKIGLKKSERVTYQHIYEAYKKQNDIERANKYLEKYTALNDSLNSMDRNILDIPITKIINENIKKEQKKIYIYYYIFASIVLLGIILFAVLNKTTESREKKKDNLIMEKERETEILKKKLSSSIDELIQLAIHNDPVFLGKFEEAYPQFYNSLLLQCPNITPKEFKLCALIRLNFSNKEIAQYNHISIRTVESQKYRLRKKLGFAADIDFNKWVLML